MNMFYVYWSLDVLLEFVYFISRLLFMLTMTEKKSPFRTNVWVFFAGYAMHFFILSTIAEWMIFPIVLMIGQGMIWAKAYKFSLAKGIGLSGLAAAWIDSVGAIVLYIGSFIMKDVELVPLVAWAYLIVVAMFELCASFFLYCALKKFHFQWDTKDFIFMGMMGGGVSLILTQFANLLIVQKSVDYEVGAVLALFLSAGMFLLIAHFQRNSRLREQEMQARLQASELQSAMNYYQARAKEELRTRKLYHDMKNMVIALKADHGTSELLPSLEKELQGFGQFYETGNYILNVLLKEKLEKAQSEYIDLQAEVAFQDGSFMESKDIVILFGNALDNAIEASMKLEEDKRTVTLKAGRIRNMLFIAVENSMGDGGAEVSATSKEDTFLHGFGIKNMQEAAGKYGGECVIEQEHQRFFLKIMIPIPAA